MSPRRKSYSVAETVVGSDPDVDPVVVRFDDRPGRPPQVFDFGEFADFPNLYRNVAAAFNRHCGALKRTTRNGHFRGIHQFFAFLREQRSSGARVDMPGELRTETLQAYAAWLQRPTLTIHTQAGYYGATIRVLGELRRFRPSLFDHLVVPRRQFPGVGLARATRSTRKLDRQRLEALRHAAWREVQAIWSDFSRGQMLLAEARKRLDAEQRPPNLRDLGEFLVYVEREFGGVLPRFHRGHDQRLIELVKRHGGTLVIARCLYTTPETLAPFLILIGADTFANSDALRAFRRDCVRPYPLFEGSYLVRWDKGRSSGQQQRQLSGAAPSSVPRLVERLLALTQRLVPHAHPDEQDRLFLCRVRKKRHRASLVENTVLKETLRKLMRRWDIRDANGRLLQFNLAMLRPSGLTLLYRQRRDLIGVSRAAGHSSLAVTVRYVLDPETERDNDLFIARRQSELPRINGKRTGGDVERPATPEQPAQGVGFACAEPMEGRSPRARPGELCPEWLWPLTDPGLVIPNDARFLARLLQLQRHLRAARHEMRADRFNLVYLPLLELIDEEIVPRFTDADVVEDAEALVDVLAPLPDLVTA
ncbi:MAG: hypothetical protein JO020_03290 [Chloroflexi bacterium]|nr:hypothetical protein [Chloroflexota bacterium]MBV9893174.1 hypothetical protein [Chloroflexota bacterium]